MTEIDFYLLNSEDWQHFCCRLIAQVYSRGHQIDCLLADPQSVSELDDALWCFHTSSFIPHIVMPAAKIAAFSPIRLATTSEAIKNGNPKDVLINLRAEIADGFNQFKRVAEIVPNIDSVKSEARRRFRQYQHRGHRLRTHQI